MQLFIVTATYCEPGNGPVMGTSVDGVFSTLELAEKCANNILAPVLLISPDTFPVPATCAFVVDAKTPFK